MTDVSVQETKPSSLNEIDRLQVGLVSEKIQRLQLQMANLQLQAKDIQEEYAKAMQKNQSLVAQFRSDYQMSEKDQFDVQTGAITRVE